MNGLCVGRFFLYSYIAISMKESELKIIKST